MVMKERVKQGRSGEGIAGFGGSLTHPTTPAPSTGRLHGAKCNGERRDGLRRVLWPPRSYKYTSQVLDCMAQDVNAFRLGESN